MTTMLSVLVMTCLVTAFAHGQEDHGMVRSNTYDQSHLLGDDDTYGTNDVRIHRRETDTSIQYFMDSSTDCNRPIRTVSKGPIIVHGRSATQRGSPVIDCTLQLQLQNLQTAARLQIEVITMHINDCDVRFTIFDGVGSKKKLLRGYACDSEVSQSTRVIYTSQTSNGVTFVLDRRTQENINYDIRVEVAVSRNDDDGSPIDPTSKFEQRYVVLIVGVAYGVLTIIMVIVFIVSCKAMPYKSRGEAWNQAQLNHSAYNNQAFDMSTVSHPSDRGQPMTLGAWVKDGRMNTGPKIKHVRERNLVHVRKRIVESEDADSVFDSDADIVKKKPPHTETDGRHKHQNVTTSYALTENSHPQAYYIEREIEVPPKKKTLKQRGRKPRSSSSRSNSNSSSSSSSSEHESLSSDDTDVDVTEVTENGSQHDNDLDDDIANHIYTKPDKPVKQERRADVQHTITAPHTHQTPNHPPSRNQLSDYPTQIPDHVVPQTNGIDGRPFNITHETRSPLVKDYPNFHPQQQQYYPQQPCHTLQHHTITQQQYYPHDLQQPRHTQRQILPPSYNISQNMGSQHQTANYDVEEPYLHPPPYATSTPSPQHRGLPTHQGNNRSQLTNVSDNSSTTSHQSMQNHLGMDKSAYVPTLDSGVELMKRHTAV